MKNNPGCAHSYVNTFWNLLKVSASLSKKVSIAVILSVYLSFIFKLFFLSETAIK